MNPIVPVDEALEPTSEVIGILDEFLTKLEAGARLNPEDLTARCPALADPLKACLASLEFLHGASLGLDSDIPDWQRGDALQSLWIQLGPHQNRRFVGVVGIQQHAAEQSFMRL